MTGAMQKTIATMHDHSYKYYDNMSISAGAALLRYHSGRAWRTLCYFALLVAAAFILLVGCAPHSHARHPGKMTAESEQLQRAVKIETICLHGDPYAPATITSEQWAGSGVIINDHDVLTAWHVANCGDGAAMINAVRVDGTKFQMRVYAREEGRDLALLRSSEPVGLGLGAPVDRAQALRGERLCMRPRFPLGSKPDCGVIENVGASVIERESIDVEHDLLTVPGNSGAGMWDSSGRLVCVVTHLKFSPAVGGYCTSVLGHLENL